MPRPMRFATIGAVVFLAISAGLGYTVQQSPLYHWWIWAGTSILAITVGVASTSWLGVVRSPGKAAVLAPATSLLYFATLLAISLAVPEAYMVQASGDVEDYDVGIVIELGGIVAMGLSAVLSVARLLCLRLREIRGLSR